MSETAGRAAGAAGGAQHRIYNPVQKDYVTFLKTSDETGGEYTRIEVETAPGGGTVPHYHVTYAEQFEVVEGALEVTVGDTTRTMRPGERAVVPRNTLHQVRNPTDDPTRFLVEVRPASAGFEKALKVGYGLARDGRTNAKGIPRNLYHLAVLLEWSEQRLPGVFTVAEPLFRVLARRARRKGVDRELEARYCR